MKGHAMKQVERRKSARTTTRQNADFSFGSSQRYANASEYAERAFTFSIEAIEFEPKRGYEGHDRWAITVHIKDRDPETLTLGSNPKRDEQLRAAQAHLKRGGTIVNKRLRRSGSAFYIVDAES
jgi:hypothetical protein